MDRDGTLGQRQMGLEVIHQWPWATDAQKWIEY